MVSSPHGLKQYVYLYLFNTLGFPICKKEKKVYHFMTLFYISLVRFFLTNDTIHLKHFTGSKNKITIEKRLSYLYNYISESELMKCDNLIENVLLNKSIF